MACHSSPRYLPRWCLIPRPPEAPRVVTNTCETAMAPVRTWAIALFVVGVTLLVGVWLNTSYRPEIGPKK